MTSFGIGYMPEDKLIANLSVKENIFLLYE